MKWYAAAQGAPTAKRTPSPARPSTSSRTVPIVATAARRKSRCPGTTLNMEITPSAPSRLATPAPLGPVAASNNGIRNGSTPACADVSISLMAAPSQSTTSPASSAW